VTFDIAQITQRILLHIGRDGKSLLSGAEQGVGYVDGVEGDRFKSAPPVGESAIEILQSSQAFKIAIHG
jgi:hypothetical protein